MGEKLAVRNHGPLACDLPRALTDVSPLHSNDPTALPRIARMEGMDEEAPGEIYASPPAEETSKTPPSASTEASVTDLGTATAANSPPPTWSAPVAKLQYVTSGEQDRRLPAAALAARHVNSATVEPAAERMEIQHTDIALGPKLDAQGVPVFPGFSYVMKLEPTEHPPAALDFVSAFQAVKPPPDPAAPTALDKWATLQEDSKPPFNIEELNALFSDTSETYGTTLLSGAGLPAFEMPRSRHTAGAVGGYNSDMRFAFWSNEPTTQRTASWRKTHWQMAYRGPWKLKLGPGSVRPSRARMRSSPTPSYAGRLI